MISLKRLILLSIILCACQSFGLLTIEASMNNSLKEVSAAELDLNSGLIWVSEDSGNDNHRYGLDRKSNIKRDIVINNAENIDWEELTSDKIGNIYIGDFGNNNRKRKTFRILKIKHQDLTDSSANAEIIEFTLPKDQKSKDFESFFLFNNSFYVISKEHKEFHVFKLPNAVGKHEALLRSSYNLPGKNNRITSADISEDGKILVLLNHAKLWKISNYEGDDFFSGKIEKIDFKHNSQKEGICFITKNKVLITDERNGSEGGNIYSLKLDKK